MRRLPVVIACLAVTLPIFPVDAAAPDSITSLLGPSVGYLLAQSDLCGWSLNDRIRAVYDKGFQEIGMTEAQQTAVWAEAKARETKLTTLPEKAIAGMKADICTSDMRAQLERQLSQ
jgi:hypothetical protein